jgi:predicted SAM-dependent methyltransferase
MSSLKVHLGCWHRDIPGFVNVDICDMPHIHYRSNIDDLSFFDDRSVDLIYCSHAFEYFDRQQAIPVLAEWRRVLKQGGTLRLAVPDFRSLLEVYAASNDLNSILGPLYGRMEVKTDTSSSTLYHKTVYDEPSLKSLLEENGFVDPVRWDWRATEHAEHDDHSQAYFPHMQKDTGILVSLNIEARKQHD